MRGLISSIYALVMAVVFIEILHCSTVKGANMCGSDKTAENQVVLVKGNRTTTIIDGYKSPRMTCAWQITAPPGYRAVIDGFFCRSQTLKTFSVKVYDGNSSSDALLWDFSWTKLFRPFILYSSGRSTRVVLNTGNNTDNSCIFTLFVYPIMAQDCPDSNQVLHINDSSTVGQIHSPYYPNSYPTNVSCGWKIIAPPGMFVKLQIEESAVECNSLHIHDGEDENPENLVWSKSCIDYVDKPIVLFSHGRGFIVKFKSTLILKSIYNKGFVAQYSAVDAGCPGSNPGYSDSSNSTYGNITTPGFPSDVTADAMTCVWSFTAPVGHVVKLDLDTINLDVNTSTLDLDCPTTTVKNFPDYRLRKYEAAIFRCVNFMSETLVSSGRRLQVQYRKPKYKDQRAVGIIGKYAAIPLETTGNCGSNQAASTINLKGEAGSFHSLNFPNKHPYKSKCTWNITVNAGQVIELHFTQRSSPAVDANCEHFWINIYDTSNNSRLATKICHFRYYDIRPYSIFSLSNNVLVEFISTVRTHGFFGTYIARKAAPKPYACTRERTSFYHKMEGKLASWRFPLSYPNNAYCRWIIEVPDQYIVNLTILSLDLQPDPLCSKDFVRIFKGDKDNEGKKICGKNSIQLSFQSQSNYMKVEFQSDAMERYQGFEAEFVAVPQSPINTSNRGKKGLSVVAKVLISVFSVLAVIGLAILIIWIVRYKYHCCAKSNQNNFIALNLDEQERI